MRVLISDVTIRTVPADVLSNRAVDLVFYGVDTVADISLNGVLLGNTDNMFVRYRYDVKDLLKVIISCFFTDECKLTFTSLGHE